ncbi:MAG: lysine--tRNA ligase [Proteobacteria bacterium]|nr:lysine--tRNA ligase [Pseudomonadota bacterium]MDA1071938.1 lysine--tRNA ligase [Pseudomonadota bacterium]
MSLRELAENSNAWPFEEARKLVKRLGGRDPAKGYVLFETGYGPSGLPHIGTFGEVARTTMVRHAFETLTDVPTRLFAFSDDMDGLRKVPDNVPNKEMMTAHLQEPLTRVPNPFPTEHKSFGEHNNAMLCAFLDQFGFEYEFQSSTDWYTSGRFDAALLHVLERFDAVMDIMMPTLRDERRRSYSPFLPISPTTGRVLQVPTLERNVEKGTIVVEDEDGSRIEVAVTGGACKLNWKPDWAMRWYALGVDYEMAGKDLIDSIKVSSRICQALGALPPDGFNYELFLDDKGEKISKSRGNGLTIDEWLRYGTPESLSLFMYQNPRRAKRLYFDVIPRHVDDYGTYLEKCNGQDDSRVDNPLWHIHAGHPPVETQPLTYGMLLNLASVCNAEDKSVLWGFISRYLPGASPENAPLLDRLAGYAVTYYQDFVKPAKHYRAPSEQERAAIEDLASRIDALPADADAEAIQDEVYAVGKEHGFEPLRSWFQALYEVLLGQETGPRFGSFVALYGRAETLALMRGMLKGNAP